MVCFTLGLQVRLGSFRAAWTNDMYDKYLLDFQGGQGGEHASGSRKAAELARWDRSFEDGTLTAQELEKLAKLRLQIQLHLEKTWRFRLGLLFGNKGDCTLFGDDEDAQDSSEASTAESEGADGGHKKVKQEHLLYSYDQFKNEVADIAKQPSAKASPRFAPADFDAYSRRVQHQNYRRDLLLRRVYAQIRREDQQPTEIKLSPRRQRLEIV